MSDKMISRREFLSTSATVTLAGLAAPLLAGSPRGNVPPVNSRPNIIVILADDLGYGDLACYGSEVALTPHLDQMAAEGTRFTDFYVNAPICGPTRAGILTGRQHYRCGVPSNVPQDHGGLPLAEVTIAQVLSEAGYATGLTGKWHLGRPEEYWPINRGFQEAWWADRGVNYFTHLYKDGKKWLWRNGQRINPEGYWPHLVTREAQKFIRHHQREPFFLYVPYHLPHTPIQALQKHLALYPDVPGGQTKTYYAMISALDEQVGDILATVREFGLAENTLVFFLSDNGAHRSEKFGDNSPFSGHKGTTDEGGIRIPAIAWWPGTVPTGRESAELACSLDLFPTFAAMAGAKLPKVWLDGLNVLPLLKGESASPHEALYWAWQEERVIRQGKWKLFHETDKFRLYDLEADPQEQTNLAATHPDVVERLAPLLAEFSEHLLEKSPPAYPR